MKSLIFSKYFASLMFVLFSTFVINQSRGLDEIVVGMSITSVCKINADNFRKRDDPCHGYFQYYEEKRTIMMWNINETIFLVFNNVPSNAINRRERLNIKKIKSDSKLLLLTSSGDEAIYFIENVLD